jgi:MFS family permease
VDAYLLTLGSLILVGGSLGDIFGEVRVFTVGVVAFGVASVLCAAAPSVTVLVLGRGLQGVFGALLTPSALAVIIAAFPPAERGGAIGSWTAWSGISFVIGPLTGGWLGALGGGWPRAQPATQPPRRATTTSPPSVSRRRGGSALPDRRSRPSRASRRRTGIPPAG